MSHIDQISFIKEFKDFYINNNFNKDINILEIGSLDVNGNIRNLFNFCENKLDTFQVLLDIIGLENGKACHEPNLCMSNSDLFRDGGLQI